MGIVNKVLHSSEQRNLIDHAFGSLATGVTQVIGFVPWPCTVQAIQVAAFGLSNSPSGMFTVQRFVTGAGLTVMNLGSTFALRDFGVSGVVSTGVSISAGVSSQLNLLANDVILYTSDGANAATKQIFMSLVVLPTENVRTNFGLV